PGWRLAVASTSAHASVQAVLRRAMGDELADQFLVLAGDVVAAKKPDPAIYRLASEQLGVPAKQCLVIEDSRNGLLAAHQAAMPCLVTVSSFTGGEHFAEAALVVSALGDPDGEACQVLANRSAARPQTYITFADLQAIVGAGG
ncbi:HAD-IA family hydrolase, partial [Candidatus Gracilibacteria bacterium]|nr:HAD-IA family hydrolase [Candidatus Gracilibacteria bacterium]